MIRINTARRFTGLIVVASFVIAYVALSAPVFADDEVKLVITVNAEDSGDAIPNAKVLVTGSDDLDRKGNTNKKGKAVFKSLPHDDVTIQVIATGYENFGEKITLSEKNAKLAVRLKKSDPMPSEATAVPNP